MSAVSTQGTSSFEIHRVSIDCDCMYPRHTIGLLFESDMPDNVTIEVLLIPWPGFFGRLKSALQYVLHGWVPRVMYEAAMVKRSDLLAALEKYK